MTANSVPQSAIRFASSPWGWRFTSLEQQCQWLQQHGLRHICGQFFDGAAGLLPTSMTPAAIAQARALTRRYGLAYASFNVHCDFMVHGGVEDQIRNCCRQLDLAAQFQPEIIILFVGWQNRTDDTVYPQITQALKQASRHAARHGFTVALENHGGLTTTPQQVDRFIQAVGEPNLGVNYDPANFEMYGVDPLAALKQLRSPIVFTHFKSVRRNAAGQKEYCRLRDGSIEYAPIIAELQRRNYRGFWTLEYEEPTDVAAGSGDDLESLQAWLTPDAVAAA